MHTEEQSFQPQTVMGVKCYGLHRLSINKASSELGADIPKGEISCQVFLILQPNHLVMAHTETLRPKYF